VTGDEAGFVGGVEVLPFGLLIFVFGALLIANAWAVIDARLAVDAAAREATRAYVEAGDADRAAAAAEAAGAAAVRGVGRDPGHLTLTGNHPRYVRCAVVEFTASYTVPALTLPAIGGLGHGVTVRAHHHEIIDPLAAGSGPESDCGY